MNNESDSTPPSTQPPRGRRRTVIDTNGTTVSEETVAPRRRGWTTRRSIIHIAVFLAVFFVALEILKWLHGSDAVADVEAVEEESTETPAPTAMNGAAHAPPKRMHPTSHGDVPEIGDTSPRTAFPDPLILSVERCAKDDWRVECPLGAPTCRILITRCVPTPPLMR